MAKILDLIGLGMPWQVACLVGDDAPARPTTAQLMGIGLAPPLADALGDKVATSTPTLLVSLGMPPSHANSVTVGGAGPVPPALQITGTLGSYTAGTAGTFAPSVSGGTAPYSFSLSGSLPSGWSFSVGAIAIPASATAGTVSGLSITVTDAKGASATLGPFAITVAAAGGGGGTTINMPTTNLVALYSMIQQQGYSGSALQVRRASDSAIQDIGFVNGKVDTAVADTFANGSVLTVPKLYDQSGNGNHFVAASTAAEPFFDSFFDKNGVRPVNFSSVSGVGTQHEMRLSGINVDPSNVTVYSMMTVRDPSNQASLWELGNSATFAAGSGVLYPFFGGTIGIGTPTRNFNPSQASYKPPRTHPITITHASTPSGVIATVDGYSEPTLAAQASSTAVGFRVGALTAGTAFGTYGQVFALALYSAGHAAATVSANEGILNTAFGFERTGSNPWTKRLVYSGSSLIYGAKATHGKTVPHLSGFGMGSAGDQPTVELYNVGTGGATMAGEYSGRALKVNLYDSAKKDVFVTDAPSNDIALIATAFTSQADAEAWATDFFGTTTGARTVAAQSAVTTPFVNALKTAGFRVVVPTIIARGSFTTANFQEYARLKYNQLVRDNAAALGYTLADRAGDTHLQDATNTTYFDVDKTHPTDAGNVYLAAVDKAAITAAFAP